jgi:hypothetical protein
MALIPKFCCIIERKQQNRHQGFVFAMATKAPADPKKDAKSVDPKKATGEVKKEEVKPATESSIPVVRGYRRWS